MKEVIYRTNNCTDLKSTHAIWCINHNVKWRDQRCHFDFLIKKKHSNEDKRQQRCLNPIGCHSQFFSVLQFYSSRAEKIGLHMSSVIYPNTEDQNIQVQILAVMTDSQPVFSSTIGSCLKQILSRQLNVSLMMV